MTSILIRPDSPHQPKPFGPRGPKRKPETIEMMDKVRNAIAKASPEGLTAAQIRQITKAPKGDAQRVLAHLIRDRAIVMHVGHIPGLPRHGARYTLHRP